MYCPTIDEETKNAFLVHGARVFDGERMIDPADVLVAGGEVIAVGPRICFRAKPGSVEMVDGAGATLRPVGQPGRITPGARADLVLVEGEGDGEGAKARASWKAGVREAEIVRRSQP